MTLTALKLGNIGLASDATTALNIASGTLTPVALAAVINAVAMPKLVTRDVKVDFGAVGDARRVVVSTSAASTVITASISSFTSDDTGRTIAIPGAGAGGGSLFAVVTFVNGTTLTASVAAAAAVSDVTALLGTNDTSAFVAGMAPSIGSTPNEWPSGTYVDLLIPPSMYLVDPNEITWDYSRCRARAIGAQIAVMTASSTDVGINILLTTPDSSGALAKTMQSSGLSVVCANGSRVGIGATTAGVTSGTQGDMTTSYRLASSVTIRDLYISGFDKALQFGSNAFMLTFDSCALVNCNQGPVYPSGVVNSGERITFKNTLFGDQVGGTRGTGGTFPQIYGGTARPYLDMGGDQCFQFENCSFDWIAQLMFVSTNGMMTFDQCHFETPTELMLATTSEIVAGSVAYAVLADHAFVSITNSRFLWAAGDPPNVIPYLFDVNAWGALILDKLHGYCNPGIGGGVFPTTMGAIQAWANNPNITMRDVTYEKDNSQQMPHRCTPSDGASAVQNSYSGTALDPGDSYGGTANVGNWAFGYTGNGTGSLINSDLPPNAGTLGIQNAMKLINETQFGVISKRLGFTPRYVTFDFWAKATGSATGLYFHMVVARSGEASATVAPPAVPLTTTWQRFRYVMDVLHTVGASGRLQGTSIEWGFTGVPGGDFSALVAGMVMDAWE